MQQMIGRHSDERVTYDPVNHAIRAWFDPTPTGAGGSPISPSGVARDLLRQHAKDFLWEPDHADLHDHTILTDAGAYSVRLTQTFKGIPVDASEVVVNMYADGRVTSIYNQYHYDIPKALDPKKAKIKADEATRLARALLGRAVEQSTIESSVLIVYQYHRVANHPPKGQSRPGVYERFLELALAPSGAEVPATAAGDGQYFLAWDVIAETKNPAGRWRILVDAMTGGVIQVIDLAQYASGTGQVFDPNPIVTSGDTTLRHTSAAATINAQRAAVAMPRLVPAVAGNLHLDGSYVHMDEVESPTVAEPVSPTGDFNFSFDDTRFLDAMTYFHLDRFQDFVQTQLGMSNVLNLSIPVDPQGLSNADNSHYLPPWSNPRIAFGGGAAITASNPVPDAADAMVVLHEYGHAIQDNVNHGFDNPLDGTGEGFGDFLAAVFYDDKHANPSQTRGFMMSWDSEMGTGSWPGRHYDVPWLFDGAEYTGSFDNHIRGQLWCATMFELYRKVGGDSGYPGVKGFARDLAIRLHLMANFGVPASMSTAPQMGQQVETADSNLGGWRYANGLHKKVIYDTFRRRHLAGYPDKAVDVYINDGREGGYGSLSGNDLFGEQLWLDNFWETQDIWVKTSPYPDATTQAAGGPGDHVEPPVGSTAYLYVRVKNRGTNGGGSGLVTVKAFHCSPGLGLVWPDAWSPMDTPSINVANILPGSGNGVIVGPFPWTPTEVGHECVLVIAECANDHAVTQDLAASDHVPHSDLVPFDNNIAQRNLVPTMSKGKMLRVFDVTNPFPDARMVQLHFRSTLPRGWAWHTNLPADRQLRLGPLERRRVELVIDQASGSEVTDFSQLFQLAVTGTIDGRVLGGMTFYIAPPSAFGQPIVEPGTGSGAMTGELFCLNVPWKDVVITDGEINVRIRFRQK